MTCQPAKGTLGTRGQTEPFLLESPLFSVRTRKSSRSGMERNLAKTDRYPQNREKDRLYQRATDCAILPLAFFLLFCFSSQRAMPIIPVRDRVVPNSPNHTYCWQTFHESTHVEMSRVEMSRGEMSRGETTRPGTTDMSQTIIRRHHVGCPESLGSGRDGRNAELFDPLRR